VPQAPGIATQALLSVLALGLLLAFQTPALRRRRRLAGAASAILALASVAAWFGFGRLHGPDVAVPGHRFVHYYEQFHYQLGSRYFPELGYDGLYAASLAAERESFPDRIQPPRTRDLRTNRVVPTRHLDDHAERVRERFRPERWRAFVRDHEVFLAMNPPAQVERWRLDLGYNPTPAWTFAARLLNAHLPLSHRRLEWLGAVDLLLLAIAFAAVFRSYGPAVGAASLVIFGLGYPGRFTWVGGAYLRQDWLAAAMLALCALRRGRPAAAGLLIGYATAVRLFPALLLLGPAVAALGDLRRGEPPRWALRLAAGFAAALALAGVAGSLAGRGPAAWSEFASRIELYRASGARNLIGAELPVLFGGEIARRAFGAEPQERWDLQVEDVVLRRQLRWPWLALVQGLLFGLLVAAAWRATPAAAAALSLVAIFALAPAAGYYWAALALVPLRARGGSALAALLAANLAMCGAHALTADTLVVYGLVSAILGVFFVGWLLPDALRSAREWAAPLVRGQAPG